MEPISLEAFARRPRETLLWIPRALDVARLAAVARAVGPRVADVGAGTGLLARLLAEEGIPVHAFDPTPPRVAFHPIERKRADEIPPGWDVALVGWMEAGEDYRAAVARLAPVVVNVYDVEGGCGVRGAVDFAPHGFVEAASWRTASFEDAAFALDREGRGLRRSGWPGNRVDVLTRDKGLVERLAGAVAHARAAMGLPWERQMDEAGL